jgi:ribosomal protein L40E
MYSHHYHQHQNYVYDPNDGRPRNEWLRVCSECGAKTPGKAQFCRQCGMPTSRIKSERYRNSLALFIFTIMLLVLIIANWLINDGILRATLAWVMFMASIVLVIHSFKRRRK